jgi:hypothetical protein
VIQLFRKSTTHQMVLAIAASMVLLRALPYLLFEQLAFDSDQAINGLMAKHLIEGRAFPLFFYGQNYMLAVEAWAAAPFFLIGGASVTSLRLSILAWNIAFVWLVIEALRRDGAINPWWTLVPASLLALAPPSVATQLMAAQGGIAEPFVWIVALWLLRRRPLWFGLVFAIAFRNREFTAYAIPALFAVELAAGRIRRRTPSTMACRGSDVHDRLADDRGHQAARRPAGPGDARSAYRRPYGIADHQPGRTGRFRIAQR